MEYALNKKGGVLSLIGLVVVLAVVIMVFFR